MSEIKLVFFYLSSTFSSANTNSGLMLFLLLLFVGKNKILLTFLLSIMVSYLNQLKKLARSSFPLFVDKLSILP